MVRFWPFGGRDDNSPDSFERTLAKLASQITASSSKLAALRQSSRRYKALFTIYSVIGYILYVIVIVLVVGYQNVDLPQAAGLVGGPLGIFLMRRALEASYGGRISSTESKLEELQSRQRATIEKLKAATKYSTTQSLIEKYGNTAGASIQKPQSEKPKGPSRTPTQIQRHTPQHPQQPPAPIRSSVPTPEQIRIQEQLLAQQRAGPPPQYGKAQSPNQQPQPPADLLRRQNLEMQSQSQPPSRQHLQPEEATAPKWYDRILDVVLGEDETSARNRYALICKNCRMVNGLAPPGTRTLDDMGEWGCARCGTMNGGKKPLVGDIPKQDEPEHEEVHVEVERSEPHREVPESGGEEEKTVNVPVEKESEKDEPKIPKPKPKGKKKKT